MEGCHPGYSPHKSLALLTCVDRVVFVDIRIGLDARAGGEDLSEVAGVIPLCRAGRGEQHSETQPKAQQEERGPACCHGLVLHGNCWAWNWV